MTDHWRILSYVPTVLVDISQQKPGLPDLGLLLGLQHVQVLPVQVLESITVFYVDFRDNISVKKEQVLLSPRVIMSRVSSFQQLSLGMLTKVAN